jgi:hypothetical protein
MRSLNVKIHLAGMTSFLLVAASLLGFSSLVPTAVASLPIDDTNATTAAEDNGGTASTTMLDNTSLNATTTISTIELAEEPFAVGHYTTGAEDMITETEARFSFEGSTTITLPNATETITTRDIGE